MDLLCPSNAYVLKRDQLDRIMSQALMSQALMSQAFMPNPTTPTN